MNQDLQHLREVTSADVYKAGVLAARLIRGDEGVSFIYDAGYLAANSRPVATTLPTTDEPVIASGGAVPAFFAGLLPEGRRLVGLQAALKTSADDELSLLLAVGSDTVGDVQVVPSGTRPTAMAPLVVVEKGWSEIRFSDLLRKAEVDRHAIAGVQEKYSAGMISVPLRRRRKRYILKVDPPDYPHVVRNEAYFLDLAKRTRMSVASAEVVLDGEGIPGLLVTRFDRVVDADGNVMSLAFEDACQAMGLWPADKYRVSYEDAIAALADICAARPVAALALYEQLLFAWFTGNGDMHAKNLGALATADGEWRASPAYDVPSTVPYGDSTLALRLQGATSGISRARLAGLANALSLPEAAAAAALERILATTAVMDEELSAGAVPFHAEQIHRLRRELKNRRRLAGA